MRDWWFKLAFGISAVGSASAFAISIGFAVLAPDSRTVSVEAHDAISAVTIEMLRPEKLSVCAMLLAAKDNRVLVYPSSSDRSSVGREVADAADPLTAEVLSRCGLG